LNVELGPKTLAAIEAHKAAKAADGALDTEMRGLGRAEVEASRRVQELTDKLLHDPLLLEEWRQVVLAHGTAEAAWLEVKTRSWKVTADRKHAFYNMLQAFIEEHVPHITRTPHIPEDVEKLDT
jgi:hypothetical protein